MPSPRCPHQHRCAQLCLLRFPLAMQILQLSQASGLASPPGRSSADGSGAASPLSSRLCPMRCLWDTEKWQRWLSQDTTTARRRLSVTFPLEALRQLCCPHPHPRVPGHPAPPQPPPSGPLATLRASPTDGAHLERSRDTAVTQVAPGTPRGAAPSATSAAPRRHPRSTGTARAGIPLSGHGPNVQGEGTAWPGHPPAPRGARPGLRELSPCLAGEGERGCGNCRGGGFPARLVAYPCKEAPGQVFGEGLQLWVPDLGGWCPAKQGSSADPARHRFASSGTRVTVGLRFPWV